MASGQGHSRRRGFACREGAGRLRQVPIGHEGAAREISQAARVLAQEYADDADGIHEWQEIDDAQQIANQAPRRRDGQSVRHQDVQSHDALTGSGRAGHQFEYDGVEPIDGEQNDEQQSSAHVPAWAKGRGAPRQNGEAHQRVDEKRGGPDGESRGVHRDGNAFRRFRRDDRVNRGVQALTTIVSAMWSWQQRFASPKMNNRSISP